MRGARAFLTLYFRLLRLVGAWRLRSFNPFRRLTIIPLPFLSSILLVVAKRGQEMFVKELHRYEHETCLSFIMLGALIVSSFNELLIEWES